MKCKKTLKSILAAMLSLSMMIGMVSVLGVFNVFAEGQGEVVFNFDMTAQETGEEFTAKLEQELDDKFDVYGFGPAPDGSFGSYKLPYIVAETESLAGPDKPSEKMSNRPLTSKGAEGNLCKNKGDWLGFNYSADYPTQTLTYKEDMNNFKAEFQFFTNYSGGQGQQTSHGGILIGGEQGTFPLVLDGKEVDRETADANDTGVYITMGKAGNLNIAGAVAQRSELSAEDQARTAFSNEYFGGGADGEWNSNSAVHHLTLPRAVGLNGDAALSIVPAEEAYDDGDQSFNLYNLDGGYKMTVEVKDGILTVWVNDNVDRKFSVALNDNFVPGQVSFVSSMTAQIGFGDIKITEYASNKAVAGEAAEGKTPVTVTTKKGYELKAGSLWATDADGNYYIAERVGFREDAASEATYYFNTDKELSIRQQWVKTSKTTANVGIVGTSVKAENNGLRFVSRFSAINKNGEYYVNLGGTEYKVEKMGMLVSSTKGLNAANADELTLAVTDYTKNVCVYDAAGEGTGIYYDTCKNYVDISACITGLSSDALKEEEFVARGYMIVTIDGQSVAFYTDMHKSTYSKNAPAA